MRDTMKEVVDLAAGNLTEEERNLLGTSLLAPPK